MIMRNDHILKILEAGSVRSLSEAEIAALEAHAADCADCRRAYEAACISCDLIHALAAEKYEPSPFFKTRVMAAIRERELSPELPAFARMWKAAGALVSSMAMLVLVLIGLTAFGYGSGPAATELAAAQSAQGLFSPEQVVLDMGADESLAYDQVLSIMYDLGDSDGQ